MMSGDVKRPEHGCSHRKKHPQLDKPARLSSVQSVLAGHRMGVRKRGGMMGSAADEAIKRELLTYVQDLMVRLFVKKLGGVVECLGGWSLLQKRKG
jgi:hypothetical protein